MTNSRLRLILSDIRSAHNVGALLRTADACAVELVYAAGYTPHAATTPSPDRPAHVAAANARAIAKTALGAERTVPVQPVADTASAILEARADGFSIIVLEQAESALSLYAYQPTANLALVVGNEVTGLPPAVIALADQTLELPMLGQKESLNVAVAGSIALYHLRFGG